MMRGLEWFSMLVGGAGAFLAATLAFLTLARRFVGWIKASVREALLESGLIKKGEPMSIWPNGSDNLPDFLEHLWQSDQRLAHSVTAIDHAVNGVVPGSGDQSIVRNVQDMHDREFAVTSSLVLQIAEQLAALMETNDAGRTPA
jgi:hypothetical protein